MRRVLDDRALSGPRWSIPGLFAALRLPIGRLEVLGLRAVVRRFLEDGLDPPLDGGHQGLVDEFPVALRGQLVPEAFDDLAADRRPILAEGDPRPRGYPRPEGRGGDEVGRRPVL